MSFAPDRIDVAAALVRIRHGLADGGRNSGWRSKTRLGIDVAAGLGCPDTTTSVRPIATRNRAQTCLRPKRSDGWADRNHNPARDGRRPTTRWDHPHQAYNG